MEKKRGLSPVIATVLLISLALVLALIIFIFFSSFAGESVNKNQVDIDQSCDDVVFVMEHQSGETFNFQNNGNVPIHGIEFRKKGTFGDSVIGSVNFERGLYASEAKELEMSEAPSSGDTIIGIPILMGELANENGRRTHVCSEEYGVEVSIE